MKTYKLKKRVVVIQETDEEASLEDYIATMIAERRKVAGLNQEALSQLTGISRSSISNIEKARHNVSLKTLEKLCQVFNCKSSDLLPF